MVFQTGIFSYDYCIWNSHPASYNTWSQFKLDSTHDHPEYCKSQVNNPVVSVFHYGQVTPLHNEHQQGIIDAITNLSTATAADRTSIYALTTTNTIIPKYLDNSNKKLVAVFTKVDFLVQQLAGFKAGELSTSGDGGDAHSSHKIIDVGLIITVVST